MHLPSHLLIILNSSLRFRPRSSYPPSLFHTGNPCSLILLLLAGDVELNPGPSALTFTHLNIRSIRSFEKSSSLHNYLADHPTDILSLNETWLQPTDSDNFISSLAPSGFSILNSPRLTGHGGGLAVIHRSFLKIKSFRARNFPSPVSFELMATKLTSGNKETIFLNIYRPPSSKISTFFDEFQNLLEFFVPLPSELIITGDFNIHTDSDLTTPNKFSCILDNFHLKQHIHFPTHDDGHTLDLLITRTSSDIITHLSHHESYQSDHKSFTFKFFSHIRPTTQRSVIHYRSFKTIDIDNFKSDILSSPLYTNPASNSSDLSEQLSSTLNSILDIHAPLKSKIVVLRPHTPWINPEILVAKRERSRLERSWRRWKSPFDRKKFRAQCNFVRSLISKAKSNFLTNLVTESSSNPRTLWKTLNSILHRNPSNSSPDTPDTQSLANSFLQFFSDKIERIRSKFSPSDSPDPFLFPIVPPPNLSNFDPTTFSEIRNLIFSSQNKQCELDSIPTFLLKLCFDELGPTIINIINFSLSEGIFPSSFKQAIVHPLLKKPSLPDDDLNNFRPISNLNFISKILEKVVASRIQSHLLSNSLSSSFQSAYRMFHSTETTLLGIHNDLILAMDRGEVTSLILLDLSAAFDTVDHSILLHRLQHWFGLHGTSLDWFSSYLTSRSQAVSIQNSTSSFSNLSCGVPQGSVLGPLLFTLYTTPLGSVISKNSIKYHLYADDTQLYISFTPSNSTSSLEMLSNTFSDILSWMNSNKLLLNPSKTEFLLIGTKQQRLKFSQLTTLSLGNDIIPVSSSARNLGFIFDSDMSFTDQINSLSKSCHFHIRDIRRIRHLLPLSAATALANSLVSSKLDYCNSLYNGISQANLNKIQRIQNTLARVVTNTSKFEHITPILKKLHWLPIKQRIDYKLCLLTYKTLQIQQPTYLYNSLSFPSHSLSTRSSDSSVLSIPYVRTSLGKRAFSVIAPRLWNSLPPDTRNSLSVSTFRSKLKTHLFKLAFPP